MGNLRSVIDIEINDKAFKDFVGKFNTYRETLKKVPGAWGEVEKEVSATSSHFVDMTAMLLAQNELLAKSVIHHNSAARATGKMKSDFSSIASSAMSITKSVLKWGGIGLGLVGGAFWGIDALANAAGNQRRSAQGVGISTGQQAALRLQYGRFFDVDSNLENIANAKTDLSKRWAFGAMGINPNDQDPAQLSINMAERAKKLFEKGGQTSQGAQAYGLDQFYTMDDLRRLHVTSMEELETSRKKYAQDAKTLQRQDEMNRRWQDFGIKVRESGNVIENVLIKRLEPLAGPLGELAKDVADVLDSFLSNKDFGKWLEEAGQGLKAWATYIGTPEFQTKVKNFAEDMVDLADSIHSGLVKLGVLKDHSGDNAVAALPADARGRAAATMQFFQKMGWSQAGAAGVAANLSEESKFNPFAQGDFNKKTHQYDAYGIAQWHADRQGEYAKVFGHSMRSVTDKDQAWREQLQFVEYELDRGKYKSIGDWVKAHSKDANNAGMAISEGYERPKDDLFSTKARHRGSVAQALVTITNSTGGSAQASVAQVAQ